jgi:hypothetical protein
MSWVIALCCPIVAELLFSDPNWVQGNKLFVRDSNLPLFRNFERFL